jgi:signal peptidase II
MQAARGTSVDEEEAPSRRIHRGYLLAFAVTAVLVVALDQGAKYLAVHLLQPEHPVPVVGKLLQLYLIRNPGAAFSTGTGFTAVFSSLAVVAVVVVIYLARRLGSGLWAVGLGFLLGGIVGNLTDRLFRPPAVMRGHVVDFLQLPHWPIFNFADMSIDIAAAIIILQAFRGIPLSGKSAEGDDDG